MRDLIFISDNQLTTELLLPGITKAVAIVESSEKQILCGRFPNRVNIFLPSNRASDPKETFCGEQLNNGEGWVTHVEFHTSFSIKRILPALLEAAPDLRIIDDDENEFTGKEYLETGFDY